VLGPKFGGGGGSDGPVEVGPAWEAGRRVRTGDGKGNLELSGGERELVGDLRRERSEAAMELWQGGDPALRGPSLL
jgi:hypothetical protein